VYLNIIQIAESFGVSESVVEGWIRNESLPHILDRGRFVFDRAQVAHWATARGLAAQVGFLAPETSVFATDLRLEPLLRAGGIWRNVAVADVLSVFDRIVALLPAATPPVRQMLAQRLRAPGGITWGAIGGGLALPHPSARIALGRDSGTLALLLLRDELPIADNDTDDVPVTRLLFFIAPSPRAHLDILGRLSRALARGPLGELLMTCACDNELFEAFAALDSALASNPNADPKS
jgi:nitrogen PTS system EIIA component